MVTTAPLAMHRADLRGYMSDMQYSVTDSLEQTYTVIQSTYHARERQNVSLSAAQNGNNKKNQVLGVMCAYDATKTLDFA